MGLKYQLVLVVELMHFTAIIVRWHAAYQDIAFCAILSKYP